MLLTRRQEFDTPENLFLMNGAFTEMCGKASLGLPEIRVSLGRNLSYMADLADWHVTTVGCRCAQVLRRLLIGKGKKEMPISGGAPGG